MKKMLLAAMLALILATVAFAASFDKIVQYSDGTFTDVPSDAWYAADVVNVYELGLVNGVGQNMFNPMGNVTVAEAITLASRLNAVYNSSQIPDKTGEWYVGYVDYALEKGIIEKDEFDSYTRPAKRIEVARLLAKSLPVDYFSQINKVYNIPDVKAEDSSYNDLVLLYRAGIAMGSDVFGTFNPDTDITRAELSALINRVAAPDKRVKRDFDVMPKQDSAMLADATYMAYGTIFNLPNGWQCDNKNVEFIKDGKIDPTITDNSKEGYTRLYRDIGKVDSGRLIAEVYVHICSEDDGIYLGFTDENKNLVAGIATQNGYFALKGQNTVKTDVAVATNNPVEYAILLFADFDNKEMYAYINGKLTQTVEIDPAASVSSLSIGSTPSGTGIAIPSHVRIYDNYALAETFAVSSSMTDKSVYSMDVSGNISLEEYTSESSKDNHSAKIDAKKGQSNSASKTFARIYEKGIFESYILLPQDLNGAYFTLTSGENEVVKIESKDGAWYAGDTKLRNYTENVWQTLRIETDASAKKALIKICGKKAGEVAISAEYIDGIKIGINPDKDGIMCFDDITARMSVDHEDYPPVPKANNNDGYNVGIYVCNLWHDAVTREGWQAVTPFPELEPYLGFYDEGSPEVADWEIKMLAEHGIDFQHVCWYTPNYIVDEPIKKTTTSYAALHDGYFNAKYSDMVKFCLLWENEGNSRGGSLEKFKEYYWKYWKEYYFSDSRYEVLDNKPVMSVWNYDNFIQFFGGLENAKEAVAFMREDIKTLGFDGIIIIGGGLSPRNEKAEALGFDATYYVHYAQAGSSAEHQINTLKNAVGTDMHTIPTIAVGHNDIGRNDTRSSLISLEGHKQVAEYIRDEYLASKKTGTWKDNTLFVSNWNEYSEGHYLLPSGDFGYGYLENIKDVFTDDKSDHTALDVKPTASQKERITRMTPLTYTPIRIFRLENASSQKIYLSLKTWDFTTDEAINAWNYSNVNTPEKTENGIKMHGLTADPQMLTKSLSVSLASKPVLHIKLKADEASVMDVFFATTDSTQYEFEIKRKSIPVQTQGEFVDYYIDFSDNPAWTGELYGLRVDSVRHTGEFEVALIELLDVVPTGAAVKANGNEMQFDFPSEYTSDGDVEVTANPRLGFFTMLNLHHSYNRFTGKLLIESKSHSVTLTVGSDKAIVDGNETDLGYTFSLRDGLPVIRLNKICTMLGFKVSLKDDVMDIVSTDTVHSDTPLKKDYYGWNFDNTGNTEGWYTGLSSLTVANGNMYINNPRQDDMQMYIDEGILIDASTYTTLKIGMYVKPEDVSGKFFQMFFHAGDGLSEDKSVKYYYDPSLIKEGELFEFEIDLSQNLKWAGKMKFLRIDISSAKLECAIDYIHFVSEQASLSSEEYEEVKRFDFDSASEGDLFIPTNCTASVSDSCLNLTNTTSTDPNALLEKVGISAADFDTIKVGIKANAESMRGRKFEVFFTTDAKPGLNAEMSKGVDYNLTGVQDGEIIELTFNMKSHKDWNGTITMLRFDPFNVLYDSHIDYIVFCKKIGEEPATNPGNAGQQPQQPTQSPEGTVLAFEFNSNDDIKDFSAYNVDYASVDNGMLALKYPTSPDVNVLFKNLSLDTSKAKKVTVGIVANKEAMAGRFMQVFFTTEASPNLDAEKCVTHTYDSSKLVDGEIYEATFDMTTNANWDGTVTSIRVDPFNFASGANIDYIRIS